MTIPSLSRLHNAGRAKPGLLSEAATQNLSEVVLLIEVADSSLERDLMEKLPRYARAGIPEVWIVNLNDETIEVYRQPNFTA